MTRFALSIDAPWWEVWRLWTGHLVHYDLRHLALNVIAALPPVVAYPKAAARAAALLFAIAAPLISIGILLIARPHEYRGASALVIALWFIVPGRIGYTLMALASVKLIVETFHPFGIALPLAHWLGAAAGVITARTIQRCSPSFS